MSIMIHVDPNDEPIAGPPTKLHFLIKDSADAFTVDTCDCTIRIGSYTDRESLAKNARVYALTEDIREKSGSSVYAIDHTFPKKGIYSIVVQGTPKEGATFAPFKIQFNLRVARVSERVDTLQAQYVAYGMMSGGAILLLSLAGITFMRTRVRKPFTSKF
jgi:hypothetical protein